MKSVLINARKFVVPTSKLEQEKTKIAKLAFELVRKQISKYSQIVGIEFGGSYSKGTWLPEKADVDIFIKFKKSTSDQKFTALAKKIGFDSLKKYDPYIRYSEHPYVEAKINGTKVNVVPCYDVEIGKWKSAADRSPFHTQFMLESLTGTMKNEVRILKGFLRKNGIYGSEIATQGFSGYVLEVLIWHYGSCENVIKEFAMLKKNKVIGKPAKKFETIVVIIDPIDANRNLAAAISPENIAKFVLLCRTFSKKPTISYFNSKTKSRFPKKNLENVILLKFNYKPRSPDIIWGQIKRTVNSLSIQLTVEGFKVLRKSAVTDEKKEAALMFLLQSNTIYDTVVREGPEFFNQSDSSMFVTKNFRKSKLMWINSSGKILSLQKRKMNNAKLFLEDLLKNNLNKSGVPKGLKDDLKRGFKVLNAQKKTSKFINEALIKLVSTDDNIFSTS